jgi:(p)ppGpp synthase/HD superfamily hydrolase
MTLTARFEDALQYAARAHAGQLRKGSTVPYVAHLLGVTALVLEHGGGEDEAVAALLHDAVEDAGGLPRLAEIRGRFGDGVADIVAGCTDAEVTPKPPWLQRKERYIRHVPDAPAAVHLVSCADKLHNARSLLADYRRIGPAVWARFKGRRTGTLWYYRTLLLAYTKAPPPLCDELGRVVTEIEHLSAGDAADPWDDAEMEVMRRTAEWVRNGGPGRLTGPPH